MRARPAVKFASRKKDKSHFAPDLPASQCTLFLQPTRVGAYIMIFIPNVETGSSSFAQNLFQKNPFD